MKQFVLSVTIVAAYAAAAGAEPLVGVTSTNQLVRFNSTSPGTINSTVALSGLTAGDKLVGIDVRPANNTLYGFAVNSGVGRVYSINLSSGLATLSATLAVDPADAVSPTYAAVSGDFFGVDFNPVADRLRVVSDSGQSLRINVTTGLTQSDLTLAYAAGDPNVGTPPAVVAAAYTNSVAGAATTTLYDLDASISSLVTQNPPNNGTLNTVALLGIAVTPDATFDISGTSGIAYATVDGASLSRINLTTGAATDLGAIGSITPVQHLAVLIPEPSGLGLLMFAGVATLWRRRG